MVLRLYVTLGSSSYDTASTFFKEVLQFTCSIDSLDDSPYEQGDPINRFDVWILIRPFSMVNKNYDHYLYALPRTCNDASDG